MGWYAALLKHLGMNGPSINLRKFQEDLKNYFEETTGEKFLDVDTCSYMRYIMFFKKGVAVLPVDIDQFAMDFHGFSQLLAACCEDYVMLNREN